MMSATYDPVTFISVLVGEERRPATFKGRFAWMLHELVKAGKDGLTTLEKRAGLLFQLVPYHRDQPHQDPFVDEGPRGRNSGRLRNRSAAAG